MDTILREMPPVSGDNGVSVAIDGAQVQGQALGTPSTSPLVDAQVRDPGPEPQSEPVFCKT